jgi:hypothetical protein
MLAHNHMNWNRPYTLPLLESLEPRALLSVTAAEIVARAVGSRSETALPRPDMVHKTIKTSSIPIPDAIAMVGHTVLFSVGHIGNMNEFEDAIRVVDLATGASSLHRFPEE